MIWRKKRVSNYINLAVKIEQCFQVEEERERKLIIKDCPLEAEGLFTCKTNTDETECKLRVVPENKEWILI